MSDDNITPTPSPSDGAEPEVDVTPDANQVDDQDVGGKKSAEARIHELLANNKKLESELLKEREMKVIPPPPPQITQDPNLSNPQVQQAADFLKQMGFVHKDELQQREQVITDRMALNSEHQRLESMYSGSDGKPKYDRADVEDYMRKNGIFGSPEAAYKLMNEAELLDWTLKNTKRPTKPSTIRSGGSTGSPDDRTITREKIAEAMDNPEGRAWYEQNRIKILDLMAKGQL